MPVNKEKITDMFDGMADSYDDQWAKMAPISSALHLQMTGILAHLPTDANILCVGAGTGAEILYLANRFPEWRFTAVEPSKRMLDVCHQRLKETGAESRCTFHNGYLETLDTAIQFDAATAILVSQFILDVRQRENFFALIASALKPEGLFICADLSAALNSAEYQALLSTWTAMMHSAGIPSANLEKMRETYGRDVAVLPAQEVADMIIAGGFKTPVHFYQSILIHAWFCEKKL